MNNQELSDNITSSSQWIPLVKEEMAKVLVGQEELVDRLIVGLLCKSHILLEGVPGLAKTLAIKSLSGCLHSDFSRVQFTPDLLPSDLIGTMIYNPRESTFSAKLGPIFSNIVLADEINRAPAKVQSALLEAMQERQVTIGDTTYPLPNPFLVLATQNPIDQSLFLIQAVKMSLRSSIAWLHPSLLTKQLQWSMLRPLLTVSSS